MKVVKHIWFYILLMSLMGFYFGYEHLFKHVIVNNRENHMKWKPVSSFIYLDYVNETLTPNTNRLDFSDITQQTTSHDLIVINKASSNGSDGGQNENSRQGNTMVTPNDTHSSGGSGNVHNPKKQLLKNAHRRKNTRNHRDNKFHSNNNNYHVNWLAYVDEEYLKQWCSSIDISTTDILHLPPLHFLPNYKNPCWIERLTGSDPYLAMNHKFSMVGSPTVERYKIRAASHMKYVSETSKPYRLRCLPYFYIIGPQKCGTTDLFDSLMTHERIVSGLVKEPHWWSRSRLYSNYRTTLAEYVDIYDMAAEDIARNVMPNTSDYHGHITVDATPELIWDNWLWRDQWENANATEAQIITPHYIKHLVPHAKFITMLRNPVERLYSDYHYFKPRTDRKEFHLLVIDGIKWLENCFSSDKKTRKQCIYDPIGKELPFGSRWNPVVRLRMGLYAEFLEDWFQLFNKDQIKIIRMEDYSRDKINSVNSIFEFLGLEQLSEKKAQILESRAVSNKGGKRGREMLPETRQLLENFYKPFNEKLVAITGDKRYMWENEIQQ